MRTNTGFLNSEGPSQGVHVSLSTAGMPHLAGRGRSHQKASQGQRALQPKLFEVQTDWIQLVYSTRLSLLRKPETAIACDIVTSLEERQLWEARMKEERQMRERLQLSGLGSSTAGTQN